MVVGDYNMPKAQMMVSLFKQVLFNQVTHVFWCNTIARLIDYSRVCTGKPKIVMRFTFLRHSLYHHGLELNLQYFWNMPVIPRWKIKIFLVARSSVLPMNSLLASASVSQWVFFGERECHLAAFILVCPGKIHRKITGNGNFEMQAWLYGMDASGWRKREWRAVRRWERSWTCSVLSSVHLSPCASALWT